MTSDLTALEPQHDSTAIETDATDTVAETDVPTFGDDDEIEEGQLKWVPKSCYILSC